MKKFNLFILAFIISATTFAQSYNVSLCGSVTNGNGAPASLNIDYWGPSNQGSVTVTTDSTGNWCISFLAYVDTGTTTALLDYILISQTDCTQTAAGDTLPNLVITQDTGYSSVFVNCNDTSVTSCSVTVTAYPDSLDLVTFTASATGTPGFTYAWDFGDGNTGTGATVTNQYVPNGITTYTYCVTITDATGCTSSDCQVITVGGNTSSPTCEVVMSYSSDTLNPLTIYFSSFPTGVASFTYSWYFSDGGSSTSANPTYTYSQGAGYNWACVEVTDANGCVASYCDYVQISTPTSACYADFYAEFFDVNGNAGEVFFTDNSTSGATITSWAWDLGNGQTSTLQNPSSTYNIAGYYTVCLTTTDADGCTSTFCQTCYIDPIWWSNNPWNTGANNCSADFIALQDSTLPGMIYLVDLAVGNNLYYSWDFGNGVLINNQFPVVTFTDFGAYNICLTITDTITGCTDTYCDTLSIDSLGNLNKLGNWGISVIPSPMPKSITGVRDDLSSVNAISLYPNPASREVNMRVVLSKSEVVNVQLIDVTGKTITNKQVIMNSGSNNFEMSTGDLPNGVYFIKVKSAQLNDTQRVIVQQ